MSPMVLAGISVGGIGWELNRWSQDWCKMYVFDTGVGGDLRPPAGSSVRGTLPIE